MIVKCAGDPQDNPLFDVIWLEKCSARGKYYQLCIDHPFTQISSDTIILYGIELRLHIIRKTKQCVFRVKTQQNLIKKIWKTAAAKKQELFDELVSTKTSATLTAPNMDAEGVFQYNYITTHLWAASAEMAKSIFKESTKLKLLTFE